MVTRFSVSWSLLCSCQRTVVCARRFSGQQARVLSQLAPAQRSGRRLASQKFRALQQWELHNTVLRSQFNASDHSKRLRHTVVCNAKPPKTVHDIVRRLKKEDVTITFARSGGAGGQNVNKVNTKVDMRLNVLSAGWIPEDLKDALQRMEKRRINKEGELVVTSTLTRSQADNIEDALEKMQACIDNAAESLIPPEIDPEKQKQIAKQKKIANENRLENKKKSSMKKQDRRAKIEW